MGVVTLRPHSGGLDDFADVLNHALIGYGRQINPSTSKHVEREWRSSARDQRNRRIQLPGITGLGGDRVSFPRWATRRMISAAATAYQFIDTFSWIRGKHSLKFGFDYRWNGLNWRENSGPAAVHLSLGCYRPAQLQPDRLGFASMLLGQVSGASVPIDTPVGSQFPD